MQFVDPQGRLLEIPSTPLLKKINKCSARTVILQGGTGSSKTWSLLQHIIGLCLRAYIVGEPILITVASLSLPHLKKGAYRDFKQILRRAGLYHEDNHNKTDHLYTLFGSEIEFLGFDEADKARGPRRDYAYINEANLLTEEHHRQLAQRTRHQVYLDLNPSDNYSWVYELADSGDPDVQVIVSNYMDNPFLSEGEIKEIERLMPVYRQPNGKLFYDYWAKYEDPDDRPKGWVKLRGDYNLWKVYGLGQRGSPQEIIYPEWQLIDWEDTPKAEHCDVYYGLDFGFNHPNVLLKIKEREEALYVRALVHRSGMLNSHLIKEMDRLGIPKEAPIYADNAEPAYIEEIFEAEYNIKPAQKDVKKGIDHVKSKQLFICSESVNLIRELRSYQWKVDKNGNVLDQPVKALDDGPDALRYGAYSHHLTPQSFSSIA